MQDHPLARCTASALNLRTLRQAQFVTLPCLHSYFLYVQCARHHCVCGRQRQVALPLLQFGPHTKGIGVAHPIPP
jgi:hypothetical protein